MRGRYVRAYGFGALALLVAPVAVGPAVAAPAVVDSRDVYDIDGTARPLRLQGTLVAPKNGVGVLAIAIALRDHTGGPLTGTGLATLMVFGGRTTTPSATVPGDGAHSVCPPPVQCTLSADGTTLSFDYAIYGSGELHASLFEVVHAGSARVGVTATGWRHRHGAGRFRYLVDDAATAGARASGTDALAYRLAGGAHGSIAVAGQTCDSSEPGLIALTSDAAPSVVYQQECGDAWTTDLATSAATWTAVAAVRAPRVRRSGLVVIDL